MTNNQVKVLEKGQYVHELPKNFIAIKQYLKITQNGENAVLLRLENNLDYAITFLKFKVIEYDKHGNVISETIRIFSKLNVPSKKLHALNRSVPIKSDCVDFKIEFIKAKSNRYEYVVMGDDISVYYVAPDTEKSAISGPTTTPKIKRVHKFNVAKIMVASVLSLVLIMLSAFLIIYSNFTKDVDGTSIWLKIAKDVLNSIKVFAINLSTIIANAMQVFFTDLLPRFMTETLPQFLKVVWQGIKWFFTQGLPVGLSATWQGIKWFFTQGLPIAFKATVDFIKTVPQIVKALF